MCHSRNWYSPNGDPPLSSIFFREIFQIFAWKYLFCVQQKVFGVFIFPYFVLSWYVLVQSLVKTFPKRIYVFFLFLFPSGINLFKLIQTASYFSKTSILTNNLPLSLVEVIDFEPIKIYQSSAIQINKTKTKNKTWGEFFELKNI